MLIVCVYRTALSLSNLAIPRMLMKNLADMHSATAADFI